MAIDEIIAATLKAEGGYVDHKDDKGGATNWGITETVARANGYTGDMKDLPLNTAITIYKYQYWLAPKFNQVFNLNANIAMELFDTGVNMGTGTASKFLQTAINLLNQNGKLCADITVDGGIGAGTLDALSILLKRPNAEQVFLKVLNGLQFERYKDICEKNPSQETFMWGWTSRI